MKTSESVEMYLETILCLTQEMPQVRAIDVARRTGYTKPSVSRALGILRQEGYLLTDEDGFLSLTEAGLEIAEKMYERHTLISTWLKRLGVPEEIATEDACRIEHVISTESFEAIKAHIEKAD